MHTSAGIRTCLIASAWLVVVSVGGCAANRPSASPSPAAAVPPSEIPELSDRLDRYIELRRAALADLPKLPDKATPEQVEAHQDNLVARLKAARANARQGDILTPGVAERFRVLIGSEMKGRSDAARNTRGAVMDEAATGPVPVRVNAEYPAKTPVATTPPDVLLKLPPLPEALEYRFVGPDLVLLDREANLIVDFMRNAAPLPRG